MTLPAHATPPRTGRTPGGGLRPARLLVAPLLAAILLGAPLAPSWAHSVYLMNSNHTDYNWNASAAAYDASMLAEMDFYLQQIADTAGNAPDEQARYTPDNWWWLWLYENNRTPEQFETLLDAIRSGHITVPLNPFVTLYGALPTEAVIRAGYYPGRMMRRHGIEFLLAENIENHTNPWGLASLWAGSGVRYTWKGICDCAQAPPDRMDEELFVWEGPDGKTLLFKWYELLGSTGNWGGYSEARDNLGTPTAIDEVIAITNNRMPGVGSTGLFGAGWDDVTWETTAVVDQVKAYNAAGGPDRAVVSNGVDFFRNLEAEGDTAQLNVLRGGWGNSWDQWPASLAERTARCRRAFERLRLAEALATLAQFHDQSFWPPVRDSLELGMVSAWKYFEHGWSVTAGGPTLSQMMQDKETWTQDLEAAVDGAIAAAGAVVAAQFATPDEDRVVVFNPLGFARSDVARFEVSGAGPFGVFDLESGALLASQVVSLDGRTWLQFVAKGVPSLGYRVYRVTDGEPLPDIGWVDAAGVDAVARTIESDLYRVVAGTNGGIVQLTHKVPEPDVELAGSGGLGVLGAGTFVSATAEDVGPVSATLRLDLAGPARTVRVTLFRGVDRVEIESQINENVSGLRAYTFHSALGGAQIRFEEIGAVARPGFVWEGGDFLQATRASRMTLNHFVDFDDGDYHMVLSNRDAFSMQVNDSTDSTFDLSGDTVHVIAMESPLAGAIMNQGGDTRFLNRFALRGVDGPFDAAEAMRDALAHQNPLHVLALPRNQSGPLTGVRGSLASIDAPNVVVTAMKPAEDPGAGYVLRAWELGGQPTNLQIDASGLAAVQAWETSLVETDTLPAALQDGVVSTGIGPNEIRAWRISAAVGISVTVSADAGSDGVMLTWTEGTPPFVVERATGPAPGADWTAITPPGGTSGLFWLDAGALSDPTSYYYRVREPR